MQKRHKTNNNSACSLICYWFWVQQPPRTRLDVMKNLCSLTSYLCWSQSHGNGLSFSLCTNRVRQPHGQAHRGSPIQLRSIFHRNIPKHLNSCPTIESQSIMIDISTICNWKKMQFPRYLMMWDVWKWTLGEGQVPQQDLTWGASVSTLSSSGNVAASLILTVSLCRDATNVHIFTFLAFHFIPPNSPPPHFLFSAFEFIWFVPSSSTRLLHPINGFWIRLESTWLWLVDFKIIPQW